MSAIREELSKLLEALPEEELTKVLDLVKVLLKEPEELTAEEWKEVLKGEEEIRRGKWVKWEDVRRKDV